MQNQTIQSSIRCQTSGCAWAGHASQGLSHCPDCGEALAQAVAKACAATDVLKGGDVSGYLPDVERLAREAGLEEAVQGLFYTGKSDLSRFAALVLEVVSLEIRKTDFGVFGSHMYVGGHSDGVRSCTKEVDRMANELRNDRISN